MNDTPPTEASSRRPATACPDEAETQNDCLPCRKASPLGVNYRRMAALFLSGREREACEELYRLTPFGGLLSALGDTAAAACCPALEEGAMLPLAGVLRYLEKTYPDILYRPLPSNRHASGKKVAVIGSGPAGLLGAWRFCEAGHEVTVFEAAAAPAVTLLRAPVQESASGEVTPVRCVSHDIVERTIRMMSLSDVRFVTSSPKGQAELRAMLEACDLVFCACGKGAVLPADANGQVQEKLFAAGTCVKNQKHLNALQAMAFAEKSARTACRMLESHGEPEHKAQQIDDAAPYFEKQEQSFPATPVAQHPSCEHARAEAARCLACACPSV